MVIWAIKADDRKYMSAMNVYKSVLEPNLDSCPVVFVVTQVDKIEPYREWDVENCKPSAKQSENLILKVKDISSRFDVDKSVVIPVSAHDKYNLVELVNRVIYVLPNKKSIPLLEKQKKKMYQKKPV